MSILAQIIGLACLLFWGFWLCCKLRLPAGFAPLCGLCFCMVVLQLAGSCNQLWLGAQLLLVGAVLTLAQRRRHEILPQLLSPGVLAFCSAAGVLMAVFAIRQPEFQTWDEFSHWGIYFKSVFYQHRFAVWDTTRSLAHQAYPQGLPGLAGELAPVLQARQGNAPVVVSMATAVTLRELDAMLGGGLPLIRIMPNTPAAVGAGTILYAAQNVTDAQLNAFRAVLAQAGLLLPLPEAQIDAASAISGCGPAFCFQFADALALGGVRAGLSYPDACRLAAQTMLGAAEMLLQGGEAPDVLKMRVCSPAGTTIEGVLALEQGGFSYTVQNAVTAAYRRTVEMTKKG